MAKPTWDQLVENVPRSRLIETSQWESLLQDWESSAEASQQKDVDAFLQFLVDKKAITAWHKDNLLTGKYKGYFLGSYKLLQHIGSGGMSSVYLAEHTMMGREVAIKILPRSRVSSETSYLKRFLQEAQAAAALNHPNIVTAYDIDNESGIYYLVMEYVNGEDLSALVKRVGPLECGVAADYICQAAEGLAHAHENNLIHRDMKPANLLVDKEGVVKILDMGLALFTESDRASLTLAYDENVLGTADYLAPEQARNSHTVDPRADIYGLGCTLYFLLTGHPPFTEGTLPQRILAHQKKEAPAITLDRPDCPPDLIAICKKMMAKKADNRQQSMLEVQENLTDWRLVHGFLPNNESLDNIVRSRNRLDALQKSIESPESSNSTGVPDTGSFVNLDLGLSDGSSASHSGRSTSKSPIGRVSDLRRKAGSTSNGKKKGGGIFGGFFGGKGKPKTESPSDSQSDSDKSGSSLKSGSSTGSGASGKDGSSRSNVNKTKAASQSHSAPAEGSNAYNFLAESDPAASNAATRIDQKSLSAIVALADKLSDGSSTRHQNTTASKTPPPTPGSAQKPQAANQGSSPTQRPAAQKPQAANQGSSPTQRPAAQKPQAANQGSSPTPRPATQKPQAANQGSSPTQRPAAQKAPSGVVHQSGTISSPAAAPKPAGENAQAPHAGKRPVRGKGKKPSGMNNITLIFIILAVVLTIAVGVVLFFVFKS